MSATLEDLLLSAEYVLAEGNRDVILCERGIRTFSRHSRYTLDLSVVPAARELSHLPIFVDPSHATGRRDRVAADGARGGRGGRRRGDDRGPPRPRRGAVRRAAGAPAAIRAPSLVAQLRAIAAIVTRKAEAVR